MFLAAHRGASGGGGGGGLGELEKENEALRRNLTLLEENAGLGRRIDAIERHSFSTAAAAGAGAGAGGGT